MYMSIKHTAVSYYGMNYVEHAEKDFIEMINIYFLLFTAASSIGKPALYVSI